MVNLPWRIPSEDATRHAEIDRYANLDFLARLRIIEELVAVNDLLSRASPHHAWQVAELDRLEQEGNDWMQSFLRRKTADSAG